MAAHSNSGASGAIFKVFRTLFLLIYYIIKWAFLFTFGILFIWPHRFCVTHGGDNRGIIMYLLYLLALIGFAIYYFWDYINLYIL